MGGKNSFVSNPLGSVGKKLGIGENSMVNQYARAFTGGYVSDALTKWLPEAVGHVTGANAQRKMLMDQNAAAREEAQRQAKQSDALAKEAGSDPTNIFLGTGQRGRRGGSRGGAGSSGTQTSTGTGTQNI